MAPNLDTPSSTEKNYKVIPECDKEEETDKTENYLNTKLNGHFSTGTNLRKGDDDTASEALLEKGRGSINDVEKINQDDDPPPSEIELVVPPDGGWGWVVVFASFICNMIVDGIIFSFGTFLPAIAKEFQTTKSHVTLVGSLMSGFYLIAGPFASAIANRYGFRLVAVLGALLGASAFALSYFAQSVEFLCVVYGFLGGVGFGFIYVPSVITVGFYFERWRALATGIAVCGSGIGTFLFAPMSEALVSWYGWRTTLLIQGIIVFSCLLCGLLFRPLKPTKLKDLNENEKTKQETISEPYKISLETETKLQNVVKHIENINKQNKGHSDLNDVYHTIHVPSKFTIEYLKEKRLSVPLVLSHEKSKKEKLHEHYHKARGRTYTLNYGDTINRPLYREDIFFTQSLMRLHQYTSMNSISYNLAVTQPPTKNDILEEKKHICKLYPEAIRRALLTLLDLSLLKSPSFVILAVGGFFTMMGFYVPFMYLVDRAITGDMSKKTAVLLISSIGISNTIGRVLCGLLSSFPGVNALFVTNAALTLGGLATIFSGISLSQEYQFFYTVVFGLAISCFASLRSIIVVDLLGLERLTNAFGLLLLFQGVAAIIGAPLAGAFTDFTGSYDASFYLSGSMILISAIMCYPLNWVNKWEIKRNSELTLKEVQVEES